jgi:AGZA family xanthine/uracil permease-like MFS transporter
MDVFHYNFFMNMFFRISERGSTVGRECLAGCVTFMAMAYILCVQPAIMSGQMFGMETGMSVGALITTTCLAAAFGSLLMGLWANYPLGLAPGMGENIFVVLTVMPMCAATLGLQAGETAVWQLALGVVLISGVLFAILSFLNIRKVLVDAISPSLRSGISAGIGLFIALIGLQHAGVVVCPNGLYVLGPLTTAKSFVFLTGLVVTGTLLTLRFRGALLYGIIVSALFAALIGQIAFVMPFGLPADPLPLIGQATVSGVFQYPALLPMIAILTFMAMFDTLGTVVAVGTRAGLIRDGVFPNVERVFATDATATVVGALMGHSTTTAYVESAAGVESGGRTGLAAVVTALCFLAAMFFGPFIEMIGNYQPITAAALVIVGALMMQSASQIDWDDYSESIPAFLLLIGMPLSYSIADGLLLGLIAYPFIKLLSGRGRSISSVLYLLAVLLILYIILLKR